ncbi:MAG: hypothetical protein NDJ89_15610 [Oligoflexia bacterium]|nr:hypothetical protein [Oligoflexia bacterium]
MIRISRVSSKVARLWTLGIQNNGWGIVVMKDHQRNRSASLFFCVFASMIALDARAGQTIKLRFPPGTVTDSRKIRLEEAFLPEQSPSQPVRIYPALASEPAFALLVVNGGFELELLIQASGKTVVLANFNPAQIPNSSAGMEELVVRLKEDLIIQVSGPTEKRVGFQDPWKLDFRSRCVDVYRVMISNRSGAELLHFDKKNAGRLCNDKSATGGLDPRRSDRMEKSGSPTEPISGSPNERAAGTSTDAAR